MKRLPAKRWWFGIILIVAVILVVIPFLVPAWSSINCSHYDIDLDTGRVRHTRMLFWIPIQVEIKHSAISEVFKVKDLEKPIGNWHRVSIFTPFVHHSPHYIYHGAISEAESLVTIWEVQKYSPEAREEVATTILRLWRESGSVSGSDAYISRLLKIPFEQVTLTDVAPLSTISRLK